MLGKFSLEITGTDISVAVSTGAFVDVSDVTCSFTGSTDANLCVEDGRLALFLLSLASEIFASSDSVSEDGAGETLTSNRHKEQLKKSTQVIRWKVQFQYKVVLTAKRQQLRTVDNPCSNLTL